MEYLKMLPYQIREAIDKNVPVVLPLGVVEYHAEHLPVGVDFFTCMGAISRIEKRHPEMVILPPYYYGTASHAVSIPEQNGTINVDSMHIIPVAEDIFRNLLRVGFRNIYAFIAHQTEQFSQGMPTDLAFRMAAKRAIFEYMDNKVGEGWWGTEEYSSYYQGVNDPFKWIQVHSMRAGEKLRHLFPGGHAEKLETSQMMALYPEHVDMSRWDSTIWYSRTAAEASAEYGEAAQEAFAIAMEELLFGEVND